MTAATCSTSPALQQSLCVCLLPTQADNVHANSSMLVPQGPQNLRWLRLQVSVQTLIQSALATLHLQMHTPVAATSFSACVLQVRFRTFAWFQLMWLALMVALVSHFCTLHCPQKPWLGCCSVNTAGMLCMVVGCFSVGAVLHSIDKAARNSFKHHKRSAYRHGTIASPAASR